MVTNHTIKIEFEVGTVRELGFGGLKQSWIDAEDKGQRLSLTAGAGLGSPLLEASIKDGDDYLFAKADIRPVAEAIFRILQSQLAADQHTRLSEEIEHGEEDQRRLDQEPGPGERAAGEH